MKSVKYNATSDVVVSVRRKAVDFFLKIKKSLCRFNFVGGSSGCGGTVSWVVSSWSFGNVCVWSIIYFF